MPLFCFLIIIYIYIFPRKWQSFPQYVVLKISYIIFYCLVLFYFSLIIKRVMGWETKLSMEKHIPRTFRCPLSIPEKNMLRKFTYLFATLVICILLSCFLATIFVVVVDDDVSLVLVWVCFAFCLFVCLVW